VFFVGQLINISEQVVSATLRLNDGTGSVEVRTFSADPHSGPLKVLVGEWARVIGSPKSFGGKRFVNAREIQPVQDLNEINYHLLEATAIHLYFTRGPPEQFAQAAGETAVSSGGNQQAYKQEYKQEYGDTMTGLDGGAGSAGHGAGYGDQAAAYGAHGAGSGGDGAAYGDGYDDEGNLYDGGGVALEASRQGTGFGGESGIYQGEGAVYQEGGAAYEDSYGGTHSGDAGYSVSGNAKRILDGLRAKEKTGEKDGTHLNSIAQMCNLSISDAHKAVGELLTAGALFTTLSDNHFALTDFE
jgi:hypothetical protein